MAVARIVPVLIPFLMAGVIVFLLRSPVARIQDRGASRTLAVLICYLVAIVLLVIAGVFIFPALAAQFAQFLAQFPDFAAQAGRSATSFTTRYWNTSPQWLKDAVSGAEGSVTASLGDFARLGAAEVVTAGGSVVTFFVDAVLALFLAFYVLVDLPEVKRETVLLFGPRFRGDAEMILHEISTVVGGYLRGQAIIATTDGVLTALGLWIVGMPYSGILGIITGILSVIPYIGPVVGGVIVVVTGLFVSPRTALVGLVVMIVVQQVDGNLLGPRIMSREVDLHPALVIFSLLVGAELAGLLGMLVAIPVAATGKAIFSHYVRASAERADADAAPPGDAGEMPGPAGVSGPPERDAR